MEIILSSISKNTFKQYEPCFKRWWQYCYNLSVNVLICDVSQIIRFLTKQFDEGANYGTLNSYRSALALLLSPDLGKNPWIKRFFKGVFNLRPTRPKYNSTWDPNVVLQHLAALDNKTISLGNLSKKVVTLLALVTAQRVQTLSLIDISNIEQKTGGWYIKIPYRIKTSRPNTMQPLLHIPYFPEKPEICVATALQVYVNRTKSLRNPELKKLIITYKKPIHEASTQTLSRWIKDTLKDSGVDTTIFSAHSARHAATSAAQRNGISVNVIMDTAGWSDNSKMFARVYNRPLISEGMFARSILSGR